MSSSSKTKPKIIFISANAFAGSTIFSSFLGCYADAVNLGEAVNLENDYNDNLVCTCGSKLGDCNFWQDIKRKLDCQLALGRVTYDLSKASTRSKIDEKGVTFKKLLVLLGCNPSWIYGKEITQRYAEKNKNFFQDINAHLASAKVFIDSSKVPERWQILTNEDELDIYAVHLRRDLVTVFDSNYKREKITRSNYGPKFLRELVLLYLRERHRARIFKRVDPSKRIVIDYDDFIDRPEEMLHKVFNLVLDEVNVLRIPKSGINLTEQHIYVGNRWIFSRGGERVVLEKRARNVLRGGWRGMILKSLLKY